MQLALVGSERLEAFPGGRGQCPTCRAAMIAKCGPRILHHWAHAGRRNCDPCWENETEWHREWKNLFPEACREISHTAPDGEIHRADIMTATGIYIEVQHSAMTDAERISREAFIPKSVRRTSWSGRNLAIVRQTRFCPGLANIRDLCLGPIVRVRLALETTLHPFNPRDDFPFAPARGKGGNLIWRREFSLPDQMVDH